MFFLLFFFFFYRRSCQTDSVPPVWRMVSVIKPRLLLLRYIILNCCMPLHPSCFTGFFFPFPLLHYSYCSKHPFLCSLIVSAGLYCCLIYLIPVPGVSRCCCCHRCCCTTLKIITLVPPRIVKFPLVRVRQKSRPSQLFFLPLRFLPFILLFLPL